MATGKYNLLDLASRSGRNVHSVIEGVLTYAPELRMFPTFPKAGLTYSTITRTELPSGDFRKVGQGSGLSKSAWKRETGSMSLFDAQMQVAEDIVIASMSENADLKINDILADEAMQYVRGSAIKIGSQAWYGQQISADGFIGLSTQVDAANDLSAGGADNVDSCSAYLVYLDDNVINPQGVNFLLGNGGRMAMSDTWGKQQIVDPNDATKFFTGYTNSFLSYMGLVVNRPEAIYRVRNITRSANQGFTDAVAANLWSKVPIALKADKAKWRWFMNSTPQYTLQASRATVSIATGGNKGVAAGGVFPDLPESCLDIPIVLTDSLITTERAGLKV